MHDYFSRVDLYLCTLTVMLLKLVKAIELCNTSNLRLHSYASSDLKSKHYKKKKYNLGNMSCFFLQVSLASLYIFLVWLTIWAVSHSDSLSVGLGWEPTNFPAILSVIEIRAMV